MARKNPNPKLTKAAQNRRREVDNARRRYRRQAERYRKEAASLDGRDAEMLRLAAENLDRKNEALKGVNVRKRLDHETKSLIADSKRQLATATNDEWERGETLGLNLLSGTTLGHRFFSITESLWEGVPSSGLGDMRRINAIRRALSARLGRKLNVLEMIQLVEEVAGYDIGEPVPDGERFTYRSFQLMRTVEEFEKLYA